MNRRIRVLFVCSGNTCRSVMAEGLFQKMWKEALQGKDKESGLEAETSSAGTGAVEGMPSSREALRVLEEEGVDFSAHQAQRVEKEILEEADYIFTMTESHKHFITNRFPEVAGRVWTLAEYSGAEGADIPDPYGAELEYYRRVAENIKKRLQQVLSKLKHSHI